MKIALTIVTGALVLMVALIGGFIFYLKSEGDRHSASLKYEAPPNGLDKPQRLNAKDGAIDVDTGHAAPLVYDFNADGKKDLLVGQFDQGKLRIYPNVASNKSPSFDSFTYFLNGGEKGQVPYG